MILGPLGDATMRIEAILQVVPAVTVRGDRARDVQGIAYDSRQVRPGYLFVALKGTRHDGAEFVDEAIRRGAVAVVSEAGGVRRRGITQIRVENARRALAEIARAFYRHPSGRLTTLGVTGTNGKTTTTYMIRDILRSVGRRPGLIGTVGYEIGARRIPASRTTPEAPDVQSLLDQMLQHGCDSAVLEVSSHALAQERVWGVDFDVGVFTNLTRDHLDYHGTMEGYFAAKARLFQELGRGGKRATAVVNMDDEWGGRFIALVGGGVELLTYGFHPAADVWAEDARYGEGGSAFRLRSPWGEADVRLQAMGRFNVQNALAALAAAGAVGVPLESSVAALAGFVSAPGRLEPIPNTRGLRVYVDYAHTDDALHHVLEMLRGIACGQLIVVFGCGGDRDRGKRPRMGAVAARWADHVILTTDNPRREDPRRIIEEIAAGIPAGASWESEVDRETAIARAIARARPGDIVLIAGKGHENYQEFERTVIPFDDREVARRRLG